MIVFNKYYLNHLKPVQQFHMTDLLYEDEYFRISKCRGREPENYDENGKLIVIIEFYNENLKKWITLVEG